MTGGDEVSHILLEVMYAKVPYTTVQRAMHIHPTVAEFLPTVLSKTRTFRVGPGEEHSEPTTRFVRAIVDVDRN
jgi:hypothetical protein